MGSRRLNGASREGGKSRALSWRPRSSAGKTVRARWREGTWEEVLERDAVPREGSTQRGCPAGHDLSLSSERIRLEQELQVQCADIFHGVKKI